MAEKSRAPRTLALATALAMAAIAVAAAFLIAPVVQPGYAPTGSGGLAAALATPEPTAAPAQAAINVNTATLAQLMQLPGIGEAKGSAILAYRDDNGPFASVEQLAEVDGVSLRMVQEWGALVTVGE